MEDFDDKDGLNDLFKEILGVNVEIKDTLEATDESVFCLIVNNLDKAHKDDELLFESSGIDLTKSKNDLWVVIDALLKLQYGESSHDLIMWWILDRFSADGKIVPFEGEDGKMYSVITTKDLYQLIRHRSPIK